MCQILRHVAHGFEDFPYGLTDHPVHLFCLASGLSVTLVTPFADRSLLDFVTPHQRKPFSLICNEPDGYYQLDMDKYLVEKDIVLNPHMKVQSIEAVKSHQNRICGKFRKSCRSHVYFIPAIIQQINLLKERCGFKLFVRSNHGVKLTPQEDPFMKMQRH